MQNLSGNELVSYNTSSLMINGTNDNYNQNSYCDMYYHYWPTWYPTYHICQEKSKIEQSFKIIGKLLEKKIIDKELTVKEFMQMVNDIAEVI